MLKQDVHKLKQTLKSTRRSRQFQSQFAPILHVQPPSTPSIPSTPSLLQSFHTKFPQLTLLSQTYPQNNYSYYSVNQVSNMTVGSLSQREQSQELNREDQEFWRKYYRGLKEMKGMGVMEGNEEIAKLVEVFRSIQTAHQTPTDPLQPKQKPPKILTADTIHEQLYSQYKQKGGQKSYEELKEKIQSDVLTLVFREVQKKKRGKRNG